MRGIDLRSDTVTKPTTEMRQAMYDAEVGDDGLEGDPTTQQLQELAAEMMNTESALLVASGSMGNLVCSLTHCSPGDKMLIGETSHINWSVAQATSHPTYGQIVVESIPDQNGTLKIEDIVNSINSPNEPASNMKLICLENTQNSSSGIPLDPEYIESVQNITRENKLAIHIDGARIFNAAIALDLPPSKLVKNANSITFCLSKGLGCPIGAIICGSKDFIDEAHNRRKITGGEMRQTGIFAAAGIVALQTMVERLAEDHINAKLLAEGLETIDGIEIDTSRVKTNIIYFKPLNQSAKTIEQSLGDAGVHCFALDGRIRMVTHHDIKPNDIKTTLKIVQNVFMNQSNPN